MLRDRVFRLLTMVYPRALRREHGGEMAVVMAEMWDAKRGPTSRARLVLAWIADVLRSWTRLRPGSRRRQLAPRDRGPRGWTGVVGDGRDALRMLAHAPWFTAGAVLTLSLGIGATAAIFSLADATLLRPLNIPAPNEVVQVAFSWSYPDFHDLTIRQRAFSGMAAFASRDLGVRIGDRTHSLRGVAVSGGYFSLAGVHPLAGRVIDAGDEEPGAARTAMLGERVWQRLFGADPSIVGKALSINQRPVTVVGIVPRSFRGLRLAEAPDVFISMPVIGDLAADFMPRSGLLTSRNIVFLQVAGRLRPGMTIDQAAREVDGIYRQLHPPQDATRPPEAVQLVPLVARAIGMDTSDDLRRFVVVLGSATAITLLLACATVANLLLVRAERRQRELALRAALGAGRSRMARLLLGESLAIGLAAAAAGVAVAHVCVTLLGAFSLPGAISVADLDLRVNRPVLGFAIALGVVTSLLFGLAPLWRVSRIDVTATLRDGVRGSARQPFRATLVAAQVALCILLLGGGLAFGRAVRQAFAIDLGFDTRHTAILTVDPSLARYTRAQIVDVERRSLERVRRERWVSAAAWSSIRPLRGRMTSIIAVVDGDVVDERDRRVDENVVSDGYFEALGVPVIAGRTLQPSDTSASPRVAVVSESTARKFWPGRTAIGGRYAANVEAKPADWVTVVGIVGDIRRGLERAPDPTVYTSLAQNPWPLDFGPQYLVVRSTSLPADAASSRAAALVAETDRLMPVTMVQTLRDHVGTVAMPHRLGFVLFALFAGLAIVLTTFGIYAVVAYAIARRTREIGIRMALGAPARGVLALVVRQGLRPAAAGSIAGTTALWWFGDLLKRFLLSIPAFDVWALVLIASAIAFVALIAMALPARRALGVDPVITLRAE